MRRRICAGSNRPPIGKPSLLAKMPSARARPLAVLVVPQEAQRLVERRLVLVLIAALGERLALGLPQAYGHKPLHWDVID